MKEIIVEKFPEIIKRLGRYLNNRESWMLIGSFAAYVQGVNVNVNDMDVVMLECHPNTSTVHLGFEFDDTNVKVDIIFDHSVLKCFSYEGFSMACERKKKVNIGGVGAYVLPLEWLAYNYELFGRPAYKSELFGRDKNIEKISKIKDHPLFDEDFYRTLRGDQTESLL